MTELAMRKILLPVNFPGILSTKTDRHSAFHCLNKLGYYLGFRTINCMMEIAFEFMFFASKLLWIQVLVVCEFRRLISPSLYCVKLSVCLFDGEKSL